jgi:hypothetical protein
MEVYEDLQNVTDDMPLSSYDYLYHEQDKNSRTPITSGFFSESNLTSLNQQIGLETGKLLNRNIQVLPNNEFFLYLEETLRSVPNNPDVSRTICNVNNMILKHEVEVQYRSLRRRELFFKWFFFMDRPRVISHPVDTHGRRRLDEPTIGSYAIGNPDKQSWLNFQQEQQKLKCPNKVPELFSLFYKK